MKPRAIILGSAGLLAAALIPACGGGGSGGGGGTPSTFVVNFRWPAASATGICRTPVVTVSFNRVPDALTIDTSTFTLSQGAVPVTATVNYDAPCDVATLEATAPLAASTVYTVTLTSDIQDTGGKPLATHTFTFTTGAFTDTTRPGFGGLVNATANGTTQVDLDWLAATDNIAVDSYDIFVSTVSSCFDYTAPTQNDPSSPASVTGLTPNTTYYFVVRARDTSDNVDQNVIELSATTDVSFGQTIWPIVQSRCNNCHEGTGQAVQAGINMDYATAATTYDSWIPGGSIPNDVQCPSSSFSFRVVAGDSANSFLYRKVAGTHDCGGQMPLGQTPLTTAQQNAIRDWIDQGAANN